MAGMIELCCNACRSLQPRLAGAKIILEITYIHLYHAVYMVFGATGGIGSALVHRLAKHEGASVVLVGRSQEKLDSLQASVAASGGVTSLVADVTDSKQVCLLCCDVFLACAYVQEWSSSISSCLQQFALRSFTSDQSQSHVMPNK